MSEENNEEFQDYQVEIEFEALHGDLVEVEGYPGYYFVDSYSVIHQFFQNESYTEVVYELTNAHTGGWLEAEMEDITMVADAGQASEFLREMTPRFKVSDMRIDVDLSNAITGEVTNMAKEERKLTQRELSAQEADRRKQARKEKAGRIDDLLDLYNDTKRVQEGDQQSDMLFAIEAKLMQEINEEK